MKIIMHSRSSAIFLPAEDRHAFIVHCDKKQLATQVFTNFGESFDPTLFIIAAVTAKNINEND
jgi:hypothetical protein